MSSIFMRGRVRDFAAWRLVFDELEPTRSSYGISGHRLYRGTDDPNGITIVFETGDLERAKGFATSEELRSAMARAGVEGPPEVWYAEDVEEKQYSESTAQTPERVTASA
jgi:hypothetical protein